MGCPQRRPHHHVSMGSKVLEEVGRILRLQIHNRLDAFIRRQEHLLAGATISSHLGVSNIFSLSLVTGPLLEHGGLWTTHRKGCHGSTPHSTHAVTHVLTLCEGSVCLHVHLSFAVGREPSRHHEVVLVAPTADLLVRPCLLVVGVELGFD